MEQNSECLAVNIYDNESRVLFILKTDLNFAVAQKTKLKLNEYGLQPTEKHAIHPDELTKALKRQATCR